MSAASHDQGCIEAAKAAFREEMHATLTAPVWDAVAMAAEESYVDTWAREWLADGTKSCECRMSTDTALAVIAAHGYAIVFGSDHPSMRCVEVDEGDVYAAADLATLAYCARTYELCPCGNHYDNGERN